MDSKIKYVAFNPTTRRYEEIHPEDEVHPSQVITFIWSDGLEQWVTIPASE